MKMIFGVMLLSCTQLAVAGEKSAYPNEKVAEFVVEKLDVTSLPSALRPKKEKGKKTLAEYGFWTQKVEGNEVLVAAGGARSLSITVLDQRPSGIYVCVAEPGQRDGEPKVQSVVLLKRKYSNALLKGREASREFTSCPVIGETDYNSTVYY